MRIIVIVFLLTGCTTFMEEFYEGQLRESRGELKCNADCDGNLLDCEITLDRSIQDKNVQQGSGTDVNPPLPMP